MTFEKWWEIETGRTVLVPSDTVKEFFARKAWEAATLAERERAAGKVDERCAEMLATQIEGAQPDSFQGSVNLNIRMMAAILPEIAAAIRKGEGVNE